MTSHATTGHAMTGHATAGHATAGHAMTLGALVDADGVVIGLRVRDKADLLRKLATRAAARLGLAEADVLSALAARERLGSTGLGRGFALPHARLAGLGRLSGLFARLAQPIDFAAIDGQPVDLVFLLLIPSDSQDHVAALASIARTLRDEAILRQVRKANSAVIVHRHLTGGEAARRDAEERGEP